MNIHWKKGTKYYHAMVVDRTLLANVLAVKCGWGRKGNNLGAEKTILCDSMEEALEILEVISKRRKQRGYELVNEERG